MIKGLVLDRLADNTKEQSVATKLRRQRFQLLLDMIGDSEGPVHILDIGGRASYWDMMLVGVTLPVPLHVTLLNRKAAPVTRPNFTAVTGDGRSMPQFADKQFDIVFSNSCIEHVGGFEDQKRMADEVRRIGRRYYVQTPNRYFPIEPHYVFPLFQFLPLGVRAWLVQHFKMGLSPRAPDRRKALADVASIRLLSKAEFVQLFPEAHLFEEKFYGLVKSFVAYTPTRPK